MASKRITILINSFKHFGRVPIVYLQLLIACCLLLIFSSCKGKNKDSEQVSNTFYTCSMHPQIMQPAPGTCPICGMDLIPVEKRTGADEDAIMLSDQQIQLGNIHVDTIGKDEIGSETILTATLNVNETKSAAVNARIAGRIEKLYYKNEGDYIQKGAKLYDLYSEELNNAKQEYLLALEKQKALDNSIIDFKQLVQGAKNKLLLWGMSEAQINELERTKNASTLTSFYSPANGFVTILETREGDYVSEGGTIVRLADLSSLWAEAQVYTSQLSAFDQKANAVVRLPDLGKEIKGAIQFVNPEINPDTRINLVRVLVANEGNQLKPGMPAYVILKSRQRTALSLPADAVIRNQDHNSVWIEIDKNTFKNVMVETGLESDGRIEIRSGLKEGDVVVITGAYLINSEYIFKKGANPMTGHDHGNM